MAHAKTNLKIAATENVFLPSHLLLKGDWSPNRNAIKTAKTSKPTAVLNGAAQLEKLRSEALQQIEKPSNRTARVES